MSEEKDICPNCSEETCAEGHLCNPKEQEDAKCTWCGSLVINQRHVCGEKAKEMSYICNSCGRLAVKAEHLCKPEKIE
ncbi:MAG: hypothetical protein JSV49_04950 [Thermoplasmata archaeon]|nr:MAG: hypothetical protein JSV49_04950 [Thermoplasmata archaeon]